MRLLRRRKFVIDRKLQFSFLVTTLAYVGFLVLVVAIALFAPLIFQLRHLDANSAEASDAAVRILYLHDRFWLPVFLTLIAIGLHSLSTTHKVAGPIYRFRQIFESIGEGSLPKPIRLRKGDFLVREMDTINTMLESLRFRLAQMKQDEENLHESICKYSELPAEARMETAAGRLWEEIRSSEDRLRETVHRFKIEV